MDKLNPVGFYDINGQSLIGQLPLREIIALDAQSDEAKIVDYLRGGVCVAGCGGVVPDCIDSSLPIHLSMDILSDGVWEWPSYLVYYVRKYHLRLPDDFIAHMKANHWVVPRVCASDMIDRILYI